MKTEFSDLIMPSRILSYGKIVERRAQKQMKTKFSDLIMPSRILSYGKIVERRAQKQMVYFVLQYAGTCGLCQNNYVLSDNF